jgi:hypothetical protein
VNALISWIPYDIKVFVLLVTIVTALVAVGVVGLGALLDDESARSRI